MIHQLSNRPPNSFIPDLLYLSIAYFCSYLPVYCITVLTLYTSWLKYFSSSACLQDYFRTSLTVWKISLVLLYQSTSLLHHFISSLHNFSSSSLPVNRIYPSCLQHFSSSSLSVYSITPALLYLHNITPALLPV